jgi:hypothetical protein
MVFLGSEYYGKILELMFYDVKIVFKNFIGRGKFIKRFLLKKFHGEIKKIFHSNLESKFLSVNMTF